MLSFRCQAALVACALSLPALMACGAPPSGELSASSSEPIVGGATVTNDALGTVEIIECPNGTAGCTWTTVGTGGWGATGNMIADKWMLTAHHAVTVGGEALTGGDAVVPSTLLVQNQNGTSSASGFRIYRHATLDVALVRLGSSILDEAGHIATTPIFTGATSTLNDKPVYCQGYGVNSVSPTGNTGFGTLRSATFIVSESDPEGMLLFPNAVGDYLAPGDSGGPCFLNAPGGTTPNAIVSTMSFEDSDGPGFPAEDDQLVAADGFQSWAMTTINQDACDPGVVPLTCGTATNAFGATVSCGTCAAGTTCSDDHCCAVGEVWTPEFNRCMPPCTSKHCPR